MPGPKDELGRVHSRGVAAVRSAGRRCVNARLARVISDRDCLPLPPVASAVVWIGEGIGLGRGPSPLVLPGTLGQHFRVAPRRAGLLGPSWTSPCGPAIGG